MLPSISRGFHFDEKTESAIAQDSGLE